MGEGQESGSPRSPRDLAQHGGDLTMYKFVTEYLLEKSLLDIGEDVRSVGYDELLDIGAELLDYGESLLSTRKEPETVQHQVQDSQCGVAPGQLLPNLLSRQSIRGDVGRTKKFEEKELKQDWEPRMPSIDNDGTGTDSIGCPRFPKTLEEARAQYAHEIVANAAAMPRCDHPFETSAEDI